MQEIDADLNAALSAPEVLGRMQVFGFEALPGTPEQLAEAIRADTKTYGNLVRLTGATTG